VIYVGSFSNTVAANLRVRFIAGERDLAQALADRKLLAMMSAPQLGERVRPTAVVMVAFQSRILQSPRSAVLSETGADVIVSLNPTGDQKCHIQQLLIQQRSLRSGLQTTLSRCGSTRRQSLIRRCASGF
jgi:hypothetical protein